MTLKSPSRAETASESEANNDGRGRKIPMHQRMEASDVAMEEQSDDSKSLLTPSLAFGRRDDARLIPPDDFDSQQVIAAVPPEPPTEKVIKGDEEEEEDEDDEFEFTFAIKEPDAGSPISSDEIFYDGRVRPVYPVFGRGLLLADAAEKEKPTPTRGPLRRLFIEERATSPSGPGSEEDQEVTLNELSGIPSDTYCLWAPRPSPGASPSRCKKSGSTGSLLRWRFKDLVMGRSQSDGKEKFVFFPAEKKAPEKRKKEKDRKANRVEIPRPRRSFDATAAAVAGDRKGKV